MLLPVLWKLTRQSKQKFDHPVWVTIGAYCVFAAMFTPTLYALGMVGYSRIDNIIQMVYYLCLIIVTAYWLGYLNHREIDALGLFLDKIKGRMTVVRYCLMLLIWVLTADKNTYTSISALRSLVNGEAQTFYEEAMERHDIYIDEDIVDVEVKPYSARPALFSFDDLTTDAGNWLNLAVTQYYHKAYVKLVED